VLVKTIMLEQWLAEAKAQGVPREHLAFKCPACGTIQSGHDLIKAGAGKTFEDIEPYLAFSCVGRWTHRKPPPETHGTQEGCNWTLGGLFRIHTLEVITPDGKRPTFELATSQEARDHMKSP
jgi:hypothetical protein